jgi:lipoic acid synthetase
MMNGKPRVKAPHPHIVSNVTNILRKNALRSVCEESACPNRSECYGRGVTTFMILGDRCTRACRFCNVATGKGREPEADEGERIASAAKELGLNYIVLTSVDRDDLPDCGASHFANVVESLKMEIPSLRIELLTPDFGGDRDSLDMVLASSPYKIAHNEETVRRLSPLLRPQSDYERSLDVLRYYAENFDGIVKSSLMVGLGESESELLETIKELVDAGVRELVIGQYLQPGPRHYPVQRYYPSSFFEEIAQKALESGMQSVVSGVLVRSSYYADCL